MACALPIIISKGYSASQVVNNNVTGLIAKPNHLYDWVSKLEKLITSPSKRTSMGQKALIKQKTEFTWEIAAQQHLAALKSAISL